MLEIGTGSDYQAAVLAAMGIEVYTVEIIPELATRAALTLDDLGYEVALRTADSYFGWEEEAPFDAIIVTAAPDHVPQPLVRQLGPGRSNGDPRGTCGCGADSLEVHCRRERESSRPRTWARSASCRSPGMTIDRGQAGSRRPCQQSAQVYAAAHEEHE